MSSKTDESGQVLASTVVLLTMFVALLGLVADGGRYLAAAQQASNEAAAAARAGEIVLSQTVAGGVAPSAALDMAAVHAADQLMAAAGHAGTASVAGDTVYTTVSYSIPTLVLRAVGISTMRVDEHGQATATAG